ncbi:MAG: class I SAM-dependent methyltransferase, partial [Vicinamibacterales bacterium]
MTDRLDRTQVERLNRLWAMPDRPAGGGVKARIKRRILNMLGPELLGQQEFNAAVVDHLNRNMAPVEAALGRLDEMELEREALLARERRRDGAVAALAATHDELRAAISVLQQATQNLKREIANGRVVVATPSRTEARDFSPGLAGSQGEGRSSQFDDLDSHKYVGFEEQFRGSEQDIRQRLSEYLPIFEGAADVLDIGCGRGEFLDLLRARGVSGRGIDLNPAMVEVSRGLGLDVTAADALDYLRAQPDGSLGGLFSAQVVEHLEPRYLTQLLDAAFDKLRPDAPIVLETINPACWFAFFESYVRDITHVRPIHPDTLKYLLIASGFQRVDIRYRAPYPESEKLQPVAGAADGNVLANWAETL